MCLRYSVGSGSVRIPVGFLSWPASVAGISQSGHVATFRYRQYIRLYMVWHISLIGLVIAVVVIGPYVANNPEILVGLADAALVTCEIDESLAQALASVGVNQYEKYALDAMTRGEKILVSDVRSIDDRIKMAGKAVAWDAICNVVHR